MATDKPFQAHAVRLDWQKGSVEIQFLDRDGNVRAVAELVGNMETFIKRLRDTAQRATAVLNFQTDDLKLDENLDER